MSLMFLQQLLRFINFRSQVRASAPIGVIEKHELPVILSDFLFRQSALAVKSTTLRDQSVHGFLQKVQLRKEKKKRVEEGKRKNKFVP